MAGHRSLATSLLLLTLAGAARADVTVDTTADADVDDAACSLREAIVAVNTNADHHGCTRTPATVDRIEFDLGSGTPVITLGTLLPALSGPTIVDGQTGGATRVAIVNGASLPTGLSFLGASDASGSAIRNLVIGGFTSRQLLVSNGSDIVVEGCFIGTDPTGASLAAGSATAIEICSGFSCGTTNGTRIGGPTAAQRNVIVGGNGVGISVPPSSGTTIQGNFIGTNAAGTARISGASSLGVNINNASGTLVGGPNAGEGNVIAASAGVVIGGNPAHPRSSGTIVQGNFIGTDVTGTVDLGGNADGVFVAHAVNTLIGGTAPGAGNLISGHQDGVAGGSSGVNGTSVDDTTVQGNRIGTTASGAAALPNTGLGVNLRDDAIIEGNLIAFNGGDGIEANCGTCIQRISGNAIHSNGGLGIDLNFGSNGVTANDADDPDTGPNGRQNFPLLDAVIFPGGTSVSGTLNSTPSTTFRVEIFANDACDSSGHGEAQTFVGATDDVTTDAGGDATFTATLNAAVAAGKVMTATAIAPDGSTSELSPCTPPAPTTTATTTTTSSSSTSTSAAPTTSSSSTIATSSSTSSTAVATTSTSTSPSTSPPTTTTTPPGGCDGVPDGPTFRSIVCRLDVLLGAIAAEPGLGTFAPKLAHGAEKARTRTLDAEALCGQANAKKTKRRLQQAAQALAQYAHRLRTLPARKKLDATLRQAFLDAGAPIQADARTLRSAVGCPDDAT